MKSRCNMGFLVCIVILLAWGSAWAAPLQWEEEWERTVKAAKQEGKVAMFGPTGTERRDILTVPFQKKFGISVDFFGSRASGIPPKLGAERRAGHFAWDLVVAGALDRVLYPMNVLEPLEPTFILPEVRDRTKWRGGDYEFLDPDRTILVMTPTQRGTIFVNRKEVDPKAFKSYKDLLEPKWKGKIVIDDPRKPGPGQATFTFFYLHPDLGADFIRAFARQKPLLLKNYSQEVDSVGRGKYPIGVGLADHLVKQRIQQGIPIEIVDVGQFKEGSDISPAVGTLGFLKNAPHPNAAKVYINWLLSKEGQTMFTRVSGYVSNRIDVRTDHTDPWRVPKPGAVKTYGFRAGKVFKEEIAPLLQEVFGR